MEVTNFYNYGTMNEVKAGATQINNYYTNHAETPEEEKEALPCMTLQEALHSLAPLLKVNRHWFSVVKTLMWKGWINNGDWTGAARLISDQFPEGLPLPIDPADVSKMDVDSFHFELERWTLSDAPVKRKSDFDAYLSIATQASQLIPERPL